MTGEERLGQCRLKADILFRRSQARHWVEGWSGPCYVEILDWVVAKEFERLMSKIIHNGDHLQYEIDNADTPPQQRPDWPLPSFDARDWAKAFCKIAKTYYGLDINEDWMVTWFANALMRGYDEHASRSDL